MLRKLEIVVRRLRLYPDNMRISKIVLVWLRVCLSFEMVSLFFFWSWFVKYTVLDGPAMTLQILQNTSEERGD